MLICSTIKKISLTVTELFFRGRKLNIFLVFITQFYFAVPQNIMLNSTYYFITKTANKCELQQIAFNHSLDIDSQDLMDLYKNCSAKPCSFLVIDTTLASDNPLRFRNKLLERIKILITIIDDKIRDENCNMTLKEKKLQKYGHYHPEKLINMSILYVKKYYLRIRVE